MINEIWRPNTRRDFLMAAGAVGLGGMLAGCGGGGGAAPSSGGGSAPITPEIDGDLSLFTWSNYVPPQVTKAFERTYDVKVDQTFYSSSTEAAQKLSTGQPYDLAFVGSQDIPRLSQAGILHAIDTSALEVRGELLKFFDDPPYDPGAKHSVPYTIGGVGIAWRPDRIGELTGSWDDLWDFAGKADGRTFVFDDMLLTMIVGLVRRGYPIDSQDPAQVKEAADELIALKPDLGGFSSTTVQDLLSSGRATLTMAYAGDTRQAMVAAQNPDQFGFQFCRENLLFNSDNFVVPASAKSPGTAMTFIDFIMRPENVEQVVELTGYPVPTTTGMAAYAELVKEYPALIFSEEVVSDASSWLPSLSRETLSLWNQEWTRVKAS